MKKFLQTIENKLSNYYASSARSKNAAQRVGWRDQRAQENRFLALAKLLPRKGSYSLNDLGCGYGDFLDFVSKQTTDKIQYRGYDISEEMIKTARIRHRGNKQMFSLIQTTSEMEPGDFTVASGIFNLRANLSNEMWLSYILKTLVAINKKSVKGFAFNCLTKYSHSERMKSELYYADPLLLFDFCKKNFCQNIALLHDYDEFDFTILVKKK